jgi:hypothetical protein
MGVAAYQTAEYAPLSISLGASGKWVAENRVNQTLDGLIAPVTQLAAD